LPIAAQRNPSTFVVLAVVAVVFVAQQLPLIIARNGERLTHTQADNPDCPVLADSLTQMIAQKLDERVGPGRASAPPL
jgi:hypothetical protein